MTNKLEVYKCEVCGIVAEALEGGAGEMICCGQPMQRLTERMGDPAEEKHVPYVEPLADGISVRLGQNAAHPMEPKHFIQWVEVIVPDGRTNRQFLTPGQEPYARFTDVDPDGVIVRAMCNVHGLWRS